jgi:hypothetical protein
VESSTASRAWCWRHWLIIWFGIDMMSHNITGAMTVILIIMVLMTLLNEVMNRIEAKVLRWRPTSQAVAEPKELR